MYGNQMVDPCFELTRSKSFWGDFKVGAVPFRGRGGRLKSVCGTERYVALRYGVGGALEHGARLGSAWLSSEFGR